ncbi:YceI-like domain protein [Leptospira broomii serovar Hurstbridge str. 5399]|uniref:YceI-like domain protein n=1 Tax=Leptospira broomii serovar Hurstbridge str. 5399 TaxID=1049789 RepID=T0F8I9_9LEPT|nr:YceI family protein [Leptospira broomii]EQA44236.1 YceI-like domain protein [Leptospira broomii serovar Hurstbridge str. 5399]
MSYLTDSINGRLYALRILFLAISALPVYEIAGIELPNSNLKVASGKVYFKSEAPQEIIRGVGQTVSGEIDPIQKTLTIDIDLRDFTTANRLRDAHLHDNYLESDDFPFAKYKGKLIFFDSITGKAKTIGTLYLHGREKSDFTIEGILSGKDGHLVYTATFTVLLRDFLIEVPKLLNLKLNQKIEVRTVFLLESPQ